MMELKEIVKEKYGEAALPRHQLAAANGCCGAAPRCSMAAATRSPRTCTTKRRRARYRKKR